MNKKVCNKREHVFTTNVIILLKHAKTNRKKNAITKKKEEGESYSSSMRLI